MEKLSFWKRFLAAAHRYEILPYTAVYFAVAVPALSMFFGGFTVPFALTICGLPIFLRKMKRGLEERRRLHTETEFYTMLRQISVSMSSGATLENALGETILADRAQYRRIGAELERVYRMLKNHYSPDRAFLLFAERCGSREIRIFGEVLAAGIPAGINLTRLIRYLSSVYRLKADTEQEIRKALNAPKYNNRIILAAPFVCIAVFRQIAPSYLAPLYAGAGRAVMAAVLIMLAAAWGIGCRLSRISY